MDVAVGEHRLCFKFLLEPQPYLNTSLGAYLSMLDELLLSNYTGLWARGDEEGLYLNPPTLRFIGRAAGETVLDVLPYKGAPASEWTALADACETRTYYVLTWMAEKTDGVRITVSPNGTVAFTVSKNGCGCGGSMSLYIPAGPCTATFREAASLTERWLAMRCTPRGLGCLYEKELM